jgi:hypothetical protein
LTLTILRVVFEISHKLLKFRLVLNIRKTPIPPYPHTPHPARVSSKYMVAKESIPSLVNWCDNPILTYRSARLHRLTESIPAWNGLLKSLQIRALVAVCCCLLLPDFTFIITPFDSKYGKGGGVGGGGGQPACFYLS